MGKAWMLVFLAGAFEVVMAISLKYSNGFRVFWPSIATLVTLAFSFYFLSLALKVIPISSAYAIWTGIGAVGTFIMGVIIFGDALSPAKVIFLGLALIGIIGLKMVS